MNTKSVIKQCISGYISILLINEQKCTLVVQMKSEELKNSELRQRLAELERIVGQKQLEIDFLNKLLDIGSGELGIDLKKSFSPPPLNGTGSAKGSTDTS